MSAIGMDFTEDQINRYSRHILLPEVGGKGQKKIAKAKVLLVGAGGLGSPAALYLAAAGVGRIGLIDSDVVDLTNLQRQILHHTPDVGRSKVLSGKEKIQALNPDVSVSMYEERLTAGNALKLFSDYDVVIDGVDNFTAKFLINDACFFANKPLVHGGILRFDGRVTTIVPGRNSYESEEDFFDARKTQFREIKVKRNPQCALCGEHPTITELFDDGDPYAGCSVRP